VTTTEIVPASASEARDLTDRIKVAVEGTWQLIKHAYLGRAWSALGYSSWDDYCTQEFGTSRLRLPREERQEVVSSLREIGMSVRAIAAATGHSKNTINDDVRQVSQSGTPDLEPYRAPEPRVTGTDGKSYSPQPTRTPNRPALPPQFQSAANDLGRAIARIEKLATDDRYRANRGAISDLCVPEFRRAFQVLQDLLDDLGEDDGA